MLATAQGLMPNGWHRSQERRRTLGRLLPRQPGTATEQAQAKGQAQGQVMAWRHPQQALPCRVSSMLATSRSDRGRLRAGGLEDGSLNPNRQRGSGHACAVLGDGLRLLVSVDAKKWSELPGSHEPVLPLSRLSKFGAKVFRDPSMVYANGCFHLIGRRCLPGGTGSG